MVEEKITIINKLGLHARAAAKLVSTATAFASNIRILKEDKDVDGKSIMSVMMLAASKGSLIVVQCHGKDEDKALQAILNLINNRFDEGE